jgi:hypothetical protein
MIKVRSTITESIIPAGGQSCRLRMESIPRV